jgi:hypothetical protein
VLFSAWREGAKGSAVAIWVVAIGERISVVVGLVGATVLKTSGRALTACQLAKIGATGRKLTGGVVVAVSVFAIEEKISVVIAGIGAVCLAGRR